MTAKAHIGNSSEPLKEHSDIEAVCKVIVLNAEFLRIWDAKKMPAAESEDWRGVCRKCLRQELPEDLVYIIVNGQELKHGEG